MCCSTRQYEDDPAGHGSFVPEIRGERGARDKVDQCKRHALNGTSGKDAGCHEREPQSDQRGECERWAGPFDADPQESFPDTRVEDSAECEEKKDSTKDCRTGREREMRRNWLYFAMREYRMQTESVSLSWKSGIRRIVCRIRPAPANLCEEEPDPTV